LPIFVARGFSGKSALKDCSQADERVSEIQNRQKKAVQACIHDLPVVLNKGPAKLKTERGSASYFSGEGQRVFAGGSDYQLTGFIPANLYPLNLGVNMFL
jgi:hypothetical protein